MKIYAYLTKKAGLDMYYRAELEYLMKVLRKMHLQAMLIGPGDAKNDRIDFGLRKLLGLEESYERAFREGKPRPRENTIYRFQDEFMCNYVFLTLPGAPEEQALLVGPYITFEVSKETMMEVAEGSHIPSWRFSQVEAYYDNVPVLENEMPLFSMLTAFGEVLWGGAAAFEVVDLNAEAVGVSNLFSEEEENRAGEDVMFRMKLMETRYEYENELMEMVARGQTHRAEAMLSGFSKRGFEQRVSDTLRNMKNYTIICNTLLRKAAERGGVHPVYLDRLSSDFAKKIEAIADLEMGQKLIENMVRSYCRLVRKHSMKQHSPIVQKTIACIEAGLSGDLGLKALAGLLNVNASYLSALFRKETGKTVTEYVNERRMEAGAHLLRSTRLQVQTIAQHCGISDVNYFSKIFKKHYGMTPKQFRSESAAPAK